MIAYEKNSYKLQGLQAGRSTAKPIGSRLAICQSGAQSTVRTRGSPGKPHMTSLWISIFAAVIVFAGGVAGLYLQRLLPQPHVEQSRGMIGAVVGLITLLLALVLGTIVGSSYGFYATQKAELESLATRYLQMDLALAEYGPETKDFRAKIKAGLSGAHRLFWGKGNAVDSNPDALNVSAALPGLQATDEYLASLNPQTPAQRQALTSASINASWAQNIRIGMSLQLASPTSWPLLVIVVAWSVLLFCGFGFLSPTNITTVTALALGAFAVASAVFLILELSQPFTGLFRIPPGALEQTIAALDR
jgi:hypothetical protein